MTSTDRATANAFNMTAEELRQGTRSFFTLNQPVPRQPVRDDQQSNKRTG